VKDSGSRKSLELPLGEARSPGKQRPLADDAARRIAMTSHDRSLLVEAGAGSGKTALMAGRIALMLARGIHPKHVAAVTFTELAASELLIRVRELVGELHGGGVPPELRVALPEGLSAEQCQHLADAGNALDEITCSTIHGFCQRLIKPYPVEANIDPGAKVMDNDQANLSFTEITDAWLREQLAGDSDSLLAEMVVRDQKETLGLINTVLEHLRRHGDLTTTGAVHSLVPLIDAFRQAAAQFAAFLDSAEATEPETAGIVAYFLQMAEALAGSKPEKPADLVRLLLVRPHDDLCTETGDFRVYRRKGKWQEAARRSGLSKIDGDRLSATANEHYQKCCESWEGLLQAAATHALGAVVRLVRPVMERFHDYKRSAALLDFNDLIFAARDLLRDHEPVRAALARRFAHVLVDEFQDTDPLQTEIFWRLCGEPASRGADWIDFKVRPGALFLVGDPKQAIYRFRGADVRAYIQARDLLLAQDPQAVLSISTNFRSREPILRYVNERFEHVLSATIGQPGFTALHAFHQPVQARACVAAIDIITADEEGKASIERQRDQEAEVVADLCARLIHSELIVDRKTSEARACRPGDIALLAPTGSDLWRYEEALESRGIAVATQAGKGLYRRQEIQDLIAVTRVLADHRDTLALGALLRGPLVGLTEEELLDIIWALPRKDESLPRLDLGVPPEALINPLARGIIERLKALRRQANSTTPHDILSQAIDVLRVRPILRQRHRDQAERALANVDLYLHLSRPYAVRGLRAFAEAMTAAWTDETRAVEGRPDAQEESVALYTMHAAKGLEWPIVIPINTMTQINAPDSAITERSGRFHCKILGVKPEGYERARDSEKKELDRERIRLWYVAATRARDLLVLPRLDLVPRGSTWISLLDLAIAKLPALEHGDLLSAAPVRTADENLQTRQIFAAEATDIAQRQHRISWTSPSREEDEEAPVLQAEHREILLTGVEGEEEPSAPISPYIQGGRERGIILHKLIEEVLTRETPETEQSLVARATALIHATGCPIAEDPARGLVPGEIAGCVIRALSLPEVKLLRPRLLPEYPVYASTFEQPAEEQATIGIADAIAFDANGRPEVVIDWKSDVKPDAKTLEHYVKQVRAYLDMTQTERGLIVMATSGEVLHVARAGS